MSVKSLFAASIVDCAVLTPNGADAQSRKFFGMFAVGPAVPVGEFSDESSAGFSVAAAIGKALVNQAVEVRAMASYGSFGQSGGVDATSTPIAVTGDVLLHLGKVGAKARPYLLGGVGFSSVGYSYSSNYGGFGESGGDYSERDNGLMVGAGGGLQMQGDRVGFFAEGRLAAIPGSGHSHVPILVGVRIGGRYRRYVVTA